MRTVSQASTRSGAEATLRRAIEDAANPFELEITIDRAAAAGVSDALLRTARDALQQLRDCGRDAATSPVPQSASRESAAEVPPSIPHMPCRYMRYMRYMAAEVPPPIPNALYHRPTSRFFLLS